MTIVSRFGSRGMNRHGDDKKLLLDTPTPLYLPEILSIIFSFLSQYNLTQSVRYVCKLWLAVSRPLSNIHAVWHSSLQQNERQAKLLSHLHLVTDLHIIPRRLWHTDRSEDLCRALAERIDNLRTLNKLHITRLKLTYVDDLVATVYLILPKIITLTEIHMRDISDRVVHLGTILALCPSLQLFHLENRWNRDHRVLDEASSLHGKNSKARATQHEIRQLVIKGMRVDQFGIQEILEKCPKLRVLKLDQVYNTDEPDAKPIDRASFFAAVAKSCRLLRCFHFSVCSQEVNPQEASSLIQNFFPESQMPDSNMTQKSTEQQRLLQQCHLDTLSLLESDVKAPVSRILLAPLLRTSFESTITTLEIIPSIEQPQNECLIHALHNVLCSAPSLLHLLAPTVTYFTQYLDLSEQIIIEKPHSVWSCITGCFAAEPDFTKKRIWACRGLRILQLRFGSKIEREDVSTEDVSTEDSKAVFGYISKVCPNLRELLIYQQKMSLELDSGFCLLSKLTFLQRLILMTWKILKLQKRDLKWMARYPEVKPAISHYHIWSSITPSAVRNHCISNKPKVITVTEKSTLSSALTVESLCGFLSVTKMKEYREQIEQGLGEEGCWPRLEFLGIRHCGTGRDHPASYLPALIKSIRPDVEFSCKYEELLKGSL